MELRERDIQNKNLVKAGVNNQKQVDMVKVHENTRKNLEQEIAGYKSDAHRRPPPVAGTPLAPLGTPPPCTLPDGSTAAVAPL